MRILIVHNPHSGFGSDAIFEFERALVRDGDECVLRLLTPDPDADEAALQDAEAFDAVVLSGGDGTVSHGLYVLRDRSVPTCVFPSGTANLLAANIGNATEPTELAAAVRNGRTALCDLGELTWTTVQGVRCRKGFAIMAGTGYDAQLMHDAIPAKEILGEAAYFAAALANVRPEVYHFSVEVDGDLHEHDGIGCLVANNAMIQADIELSPDCSMADGLLDVIVLETDRAPKLLRPLVAGLVDPTGKGVGRPHLALYRGKHIGVTADKALKMEIDGDVISGDVHGWEADVLPGCSRIVVDSLSRYT